MYSPHITSPQTHYCHCPITEARDCDLKYQEKVIKYKKEVEQLKSEIEQLKALLKEKAPLYGIDIRTMQAELEKSKQEVERLKEERNKQFCGKCRWRTALDKLSRYEGGVEVKGMVDRNSWILSDGTHDHACLTVRIPSSYIGQCVRVLVFKEDNNG